MKAASFKYVRPDSREEALSHLGDNADDVKVLAGGQSLVPMMNFRLARPAVVVDIARLDDLRTVDESEHGVHVGATVRHIELQNRAGRDPLTSLLRQTAVHIGHMPIRVRGTFGGSLAHSDAASEWCLIARLLDGDIQVESRDRGTRSIPAGDFFQSLFVTAMEPDELLTKVRLPVLGESHRTGFGELARRRGDFAIVSLGVDLVVTDSKVTAARVCIGGVAETPFRATEAEAALVGLEWDGHGTVPKALVEASHVAAGEVSPQTDLHGTDQYRRDLVQALLTRVVKQAFVAGKVQ